MNKTCYLAETGEKYSFADREKLYLKKREAKEQIDQWKKELQTEGRWFSVSELEASVKCEGKE